MDNVIQLSSSGTRRQGPPENRDEIISNARALLSATVDSIRNADGDTDACHLAAVEKIKALLYRVCDAGDGDLVHFALQALSLVELSRIALAIDPKEIFEDDGNLTYGYMIAEALESAETRLAEVTNG